MFTNEVTSMEQHGFIQDMLDVKVLILFVMAKLSYPVTLQTIYELCYQDDKLSYFDVSVAVPQMVQSGHLQQLPDDTYVITDKGREHEEITCDAIAYPVMQRALMAVQRYNTRIQRKGLIETKIEPGGNGRLSRAAVPARRCGRSHEAGACRADAFAGPNARARV